MNNICRDTADREETQIDDFFILFDWHVYKWRLPTNVAHRNKFTPI